MKRLVLILCVLSIGCAGWTSGDTYRQAAVTGLSGVDWMQTRKIAQNPDKWYERNPVLGKHPSVEEVDMWFAGGIVAHTAISMLLPPKPRMWWQYVSIAWEGAMVGNNLRIGLGFGF